MTQDPKHTQKQKIKLLCGIILLLLLVFVLGIGYQRNTNITNRTLRIIKDLEWFNILLADNNVSENDIMDMKRVAFNIESNLSGLLSQLQTVYPKKYDEIRQEARASVMLYSHVHDQIMYELSTPLDFRQAENQRDVDLLYAINDICLQRFKEQCDGEHIVHLSQVSAVCEAIWTDIGNYFVSKYNKYVLPQANVSIFEFIPDNP